VRLREGGRKQGARVSRQWRRKSVGQRRKGGAVQLGSCEELIHLGVSWDLFKSLVDTYSLYSAQESSSRLGRLGGHFHYS
jgi:hypothetical protein